MSCYKYFFIIHILGTDDTNENHIKPLKLFDPFMLKPVKFTMYGKAFFRHLYEHFSSLPASRSFTYF